MSDRTRTGSATRPTRSCVEDSRLENDDARDGGRRCGLVNEGNRKAVRCGHRLRLRRSPVATTDTSIAGRMSQRFSKESIANSEWMRYRTASEESMNRNSFKLALVALVAAVALAVPAEAAGKKAVRHRTK